jgi:hypothetical protein
MKRSKLINIVSDQPLIEDHSLFGDPKRQRLGHSGGILPHKVFYNHSSMRILIGQFTFNGYCYGEIIHENTLNKVFSSKENRLIFVQVINIFDLFENRHLEDI